MKFTCNTKELSEACSNVMRAVSTKVTIPTIEGILMECGSDTLSLTGYDFEFGISYPFILNTLPLLVKSIIKS